MMGWMDRVSAWLRREADDAKDWIDDAVADGNAELDRAERRISDDPSVRLQATLEDIEAGEDSYSALRDRAEGRAVGPSAAAELGPEEGKVFSVEPVAREPETSSHVEELPPSTGAAMARLWVHEHPDSRPGYHSVFIDGVVGSVVGEEWFSGSFVDEVSALDEVDEAVHEEREILHLRGSTLTPARARMLVAEVLAPRIGDDWQERLG